MASIVKYEQYCVWRNSDSTNLYEVSGDGLGHWQLIVYEVVDNSAGKMKWVGLKNGVTPGTLDYDTPEGEFTRTHGCDSTPVRVVTPGCVRFPVDTTSCSRIYCALVSNTGTDLDGLWILNRYDNQPFWSSSFDFVEGVSRPSGLTGDEEIDLWPVGDQWMLQIKFSGLGSPQWITPIVDLGCPPTAGWTNTHDSSSSPSSGSVGPTLGSESNSSQSQNVDNIASVTVSTSCTDFSSSSG